VKYVCIAASILSLLLGCYIGSKLPARTVVREIPVVTTKTQTVTKVIEKFPDGKVVERFTTQTVDKAQASPQPKVPQYRAGILMPIASELKLPTITASRRLFSRVWLDTSLDIRHKEALIGISYEF
jgi:hypothetical protein